MGLTGQCSRTEHPLGRHACRGGDRDNRRRTGNAQELVDPLADSLEAMEAELLRET